MEFSKSIQSMKKRYFYSHQKPKKACLRDLFDFDCFMGKLKNKFMIFALHRVSSIS